MKFLNSCNFLDLSNTTSIITGGAGMLGRQYTAALLQCGSQVIILDNKSSKTNLINHLKKESRLDKNLLSNLNLVKCDITNHNQVKKTFTSLRNSLKNLKILVNNASLVKQVKKNSDLINVYKPFLKMLPKDWEEYFSIDLTGTLLVTQHSIPYMQKNGGGSIINISSTYGILSPDQSLYDYFNKKLTTKQKKMGIVIEKPIGYSISKSGILNLTRFIATKFAQDNIRVNTLTLGGVFDENPSQFVKAYSKKTPLNRMAKKQEYIGPLLFLASNMSSYMTGSNLIVDGGWSAW